MLIVTYECDVCDFVGTASERVLYYLFAVGERLLSYSVPVWCRTCNRLASAESLPTTEQMIAEIERLRSPHRETLHHRDENEFDIEVAVMLNESLEERLAGKLATLTEYDNRFRSRVSPNRCLECGTTNFDYLQDHHGHMPEHLPHPHCLGTLHRRDVGIAIPSSYVKLDMEGNRIVDDETT